MHRWLSTLTRAGNGLWSKDTRGSNEGAGTPTPVSMVCICSVESLSCHRAPGPFIIMQGKPRLHSHLLLGRVVTTAPRFLQSQTRMIKTGLIIAGECDAVGSFCRYLNWLKPPSKLERNSNHHISRLVSSRCGKTPCECQWGEMGSGYEEQSVRS